MAAAGAVVLDSPNAVHKPLSFRIRAELFTQLAQMETAGLPFNRAIAVLNLPGAAQPRLVAMREIIGNGNDPAMAGEKSGLFTKLESRLVRAALSAGSPAGMYRQLADYYTDRAMQLATMKSRLMMPAFTFLLALLIQPLPALVGGSIGVAGYLWGALKPMLAIAAAIVGIRWLAAGDASSKGKSFYQRMPIYGPVFVRRNLRDFFESLALLLEAGVSMLDALPAALDTVEDGDIRRELTKIRARIAQGVPVAQALRDITYIKDERVIQFAETGEASGTLPEMLMRHTALETAAINSTLEQLAAWVPRILYALVAVWIAYGLLVGGAFMPRVPKDL